MKTRWTLQEWQAERLRRRRIGDLISPGECGRTESRNDAELRDAFAGRRNLRFATTEELRAKEETGPERGGNNLPESPTVPNGADLALKG
jgi:hypothetical protein